MEFLADVCPGKGGESAAFSFSVSGKEEKNGRCYALPLETASSCVVPGWLSPIPRRNSSCVLRLRTSALRSAGECGAAPEFLRCLDAAKTAKREKCRRQKQTTSGQGSSGGPSPTAG